MHYHQDLSPSFFHDRDPLSGMPSQIVAALQKRGLVSRGKMPRVEFVGILLEEKICIFLPRGVEIPASTADKVMLAATTLKSVVKYADSTKASKSTEDEGEGKNSTEELSLYLKLLDDYRQNGLYAVRRTIRKFNSGKTDWRKTVSNIAPLPDKNLQPIYIDTFGIKHEYFDRNEIAAIHAQCIRSIDEKFSWIVSGKLRLIAPELRDIRSPTGNTIRKLSLLKKELGQTYSDRDIRLLKQLIRFLEKTNDNQPSSFIAGLNKFEFCWEHMLEAVLGHTIDINSQLPAPAYIDHAGKIHSANEKSMRTDIVLRKDSDSGRQYVIADAKYYSAITARDAPGWGDIVKQFFYAVAVRSIEKRSTKIKNVFIFPGSKSHFHRVLLRDRSGSGSIPVFPSEFQPIYCHYVPPSEVLVHYLGNTTMSALTEELLEPEADDPEIVKS